MIERIIINNIEYEALRYQGDNAADIWSFIHCRVSVDANKLLSYFVRKGPHRGWNYANTGDYIVKAKEDDAYFTYCERDEFF